MKISKSISLVIGLIAIIVPQIQCSFPKGFAWGTATAAYQVEGATETDGRGKCIWDDFSDIPGKIARGENAKVADDFYHRWREDLYLMSMLGIKHFRLSISWSRVLPNGTTDSPNQQGIDYYNSIFDLMQKLDITPWVTLYHWDLPSALNDKTSTGGWLNPKIPDIFASYADFCFKTFGSKVKKWITINEPQSFAWGGYGGGWHAPGRCSDYIQTGCKDVGGGGDTPTEPYIVSHHVILAHAQAVKVYRDSYQKDQGGEIGITLNSEYYEPFNSTNPDDIKAVDTKILFQYGWYAHPLVFGDYPGIMRTYISGNRLPNFTTDEQALIKGSFDFLGLNHYTSKYIKYTGTVGKDYSDDHRSIQYDQDINGNLIGPYAESTWLNLYPIGIRKLLEWLDTTYNHPKIIILENGVSAPGENSKPVDQAIHDQFRTFYYKSYIQNVEDAINTDKVNVMGYFAWSFLDNFEWVDGYSVRFGMIYVDYINNQQRIIKDSALWYSDWIKYQDSVSNQSNGKNNQIIQLTAQLIYY